MTEQRRLVVMRHAKAEPYARTDHARLLTDRGIAQATAAGARLKDRGLVPDHVAVSSAVRALLTWDAVAAVTGSKAVPHVDASLYSSGVDVLLETFRATSEDVSTLLFVGHNPTAAELCHLLDDGEGDQQALSGMLHGFPPGALAVFEIAGPWADLGAESGRVVDFFAPD